MNPSIHDHEVLHFMLKNKTGFTRQGLKEAIEQRFGTGARFHTCSAEDMSTENLIDFLSAKGKFIENSDSFNTQPDKICSHWTRLQ